MRSLFVFIVLFVAIAWAYPAVEDPSLEYQQALLDVDSQGHENESPRIARQFGFGGFGRGFGGFGGGYGGYGGGFGHHHHGGFGHHHHGGFGHHHHGFGGFYG